MDTSLPHNNEHLGGTIERVTFHSVETGFCVLRVKTGRKQGIVTVIGFAPSVSPGEQVECLGLWVNDREHGLQFKARQTRIFSPSTKEGMEKYLASGMVRGIGPHFAKKMIEAFGNKVFDIIEKSPDTLTKLPGIGKKRMESITRGWAEQKIVREIMVFLQSHGVGTARAVRIYKTYGDSAIAKVSENPYRLALDIHGIGFKSADQIALHLGIPRDSIVRARAGLRHLLKEMAGEGHCAYPCDKITEAAVRLMGIAEKTIEKALREEIADQNIIEEEISGSPCLFISPLYYAETGVARHILRLMAGRTDWREIDLVLALPWVENTANINLSPMQAKAIELVIRNKVSVITGGPGVGKTTIVNSILKILNAKGVRALLCAPTGRAAKRMTEMTGQEAKTIHRLLEFDPKLFRFRKGPGEPLDGDIVVVDEASMVDIVLMNQLLRAIPDKMALLLVGDMNQLPSIGPGSVLSDIISSDRVRVIKLTRIFRQARHSMIVVNAHRINRGKMPDKDDADPLSDFYFISVETPEAIFDTLTRVVSERIPKRFGFDPVKDIQVLTPMNRGGLGTHSLNIELQSRLNPSGNPKIERFGSTYAPGDKVIQLINNYDKDVYNGDIGIIKRIDLLENDVYVDYDGSNARYQFGEMDELSLAYAITIHKSQGSEYPAVVIPLATQHYTLLERNLIYTGVTRGKKLVVIIGQRRALAIAVNKITANKRVTNLGNRLLS